MNTKLLVTVCDTKAGYYFQPQVVRTKGEYIRMIQEQLQNPESTIAKHPADYHFFEIGTWDEVTGEINLHESKISIGNGLDLKA